MRRLHSILAVSLLAISAAADYTVDEDASVFAIVLGKEGIGSAMAHNHFIVAHAHSVSIAVDASKPEQISFRFDAPVAELVVDDPDLQGRWWPRIEALKLLPSGFTKAKDKDRAAIKQHMLSPEQLHGSMYRTIKAEIIGITASPQTYNERPFEHGAQLQVSIRGETITIPVFYDVTEDESGMTVEAVAPMRLTAVGIEPYSAFLGAVRVKDKCHFYVQMRLRKEEAAQSEDTSELVLSEGTDR